MQLEHLVHEDELERFVGGEVVIIRTYPDTLLRARLNSFTVHDETIVANITTKDWSYGTFENIERCNWNPTAGSSQVILSRSVSLDGTNIAFAASPQGTSAYLTEPAA